MEQKLCERCGTDDPKIDYTETTSADGSVERVCEYCTSTEEQVNKKENKVDNPFISMTLQEVRNILKHHRLDEGKKLSDDFIEKLRACARDSYATIYKTYQDNTFSPEVLATLCALSDAMKELSTSYSEDTEKVTASNNARTFVCHECGRGCVITDRNGSVFRPCECAYDNKATPCWRELFEDGKPNFLREMDLVKLSDFFVLDDKDTFLVAYSFIEEEEYDEVVEMLKGAQGLHYFQAIFDDCSCDLEYANNMLKYLVKHEQPEQVYAFVEYMYR
jgi:hypothetical protein